MRILLHPESRWNIRAEQLLLTAWFLCVAASLHAATLTFKSGATFEGEVVEFIGTNSVIVKSSKDYKPYTITISMLSTACQEYLAACKERLTTNTPSSTESGLRIETFTFKSGAIFQGEIVEFIGTNSVVVKSSKDYKPYTITISMLSDTNQHYLARRRKMMAMNPGFDYGRDPRIQANRRAMDKMRARKKLLTDEYNSVENTRQAKVRKGESPDSEQRQLDDLKRRLREIDRQIRDYERFNITTAQSYSERQSKIPLTPK